ncbi:MAG: PAS domain S-box protein [Candidatus Delongbacteria bacterium]
MSDDPTRLQRILDQLTVMMDHMAVQTWYLTDEDTYGLVNQAHARFLGRDKEELEGRRLEEIFPPAVAEVCRRSNRMVLETRAPVEVEEWVTDARGELRLLEIAKTPSISAAGTVSHIICSGQDITRRRAAEERLAQSEANFRALVETLDDLVLISGAEERILYANPAAIRKLDYADEVLRAMTLVELHPAWDQPEAARSLEELVAGTRSSCRFPLRSRQGGLIPVETRLWTGTWNGQPCRFGLCKDLSKEQESQQRFETLFRRNPALMAINDAQTLQFVDINESFVKALGYSREELLGRTSRELELFPDPEQQARVAEMVRTYGKVEEVELSVRDKAGQLHAGLFAGDLVESQGQHYFLTVMVDISERRRAAEERERVIVELRSAMDQIKTLKGIVPICAKCKKIRDDRGYWQQVEAYISQRTEANFSHGLCPDCVETLYVHHGLGESGGPTE